MIMRRRVVIGVYLIVFILTLLHFVIRFRHPNISHNIPELNKIGMLHERTYGVIGVLSTDMNQLLRDKHRKIFSNFKICNVLIRYLVDSPSEKYIQESVRHGDIIFLNTSYSGRAIQFGERISKWFNISAEIFPDAQFVGKMDDDVYICDHSFKPVWENWSSLMYLVSASNEQDLTWSNLKRITDDTFVVLGKELVKRISNRRYCYNLSVCDKTKDLCDIGAESLGIWLSIYDDIKYIYINALAVHNRTLSFEIDICSNFFLLHCKYFPEVIENIYNERISMKDDHTILSTAGVTGIVFDGKKKRSFHGPNDINQIKVFQWRDNISCPFWGVLTTINSYNTNVEKVLKEMCLVIVADTKTPENTYLRFKKTMFVKFLSVNDQENLLIRGLEIMAHVPWNHFGRKNVGYVYAIMHGAKSIFDFDDDNMITDVLPTYKEWFIAPAVRAFNPYPSYISLNDIPWPRGYPLSEIHNASTWTTIYHMHKQYVDGLKIGIIQSLANHDPDVDAIWRLTRKLPITFANNIPVLLQSGTLSPYNAQATLHYALWGLLLPVSVHGRVSDIWRSYITQRLMWDVGQTIGFVSPFVKQMRNVHDNNADFNSEIPLYVKTDALIDVLYKWNSSSDNLETRMVELYIELYEREFIDFSDVIFVQKWIRTLKQINYKFPYLLSRSIRKQMISK